MLLMPMDIIVLDAGPKPALLSRALHPMIRWRQLDTSVHCAPVRSVDGTVYEVSPKGIQLVNIGIYAGRRVTIHRHKGKIDHVAMVAWCDEKMRTCKGYDAYHQWFLGFALGIMVQKICDDPDRWTCAELPYWCFQENGILLTSKEEVLPMPRLFRYSSLFDLVYDGDPRWIR